MAEVLCLDVPPHILARLQRTRGGLPLNVREVSSPEHLRAELARHAVTHDAVLLGARAQEPLRLAQRAHALDPTLSLVLSAPPDQVESLRQAVRFSPLLGSEVTCVAEGELDELVSALTAAVIRTRQRRTPRRLDFDLEEATRTHAAEPVQCLDRLLERAPIGVALLNHTGAVQAWNQRASALLEMAERDVVGRPFVLAFPEAEWQRLADYLARCAATERPVPSEEFEFRGASGSTRVLEVTAASTPGRAGRPAVLVLIQDVTARVRAEEDGRRLHERLLELKRIDHLRALAGGIANDFNNLLATLAGNAELILSDLPAHSEGRALATSMREAVLRATQLTHQLLAYAGSAPTRRERIDLDEAVRETVRLLHLTWPSDVRVLLRPGPDLPAVRADALLLRDVVIGLVTRSVGALGGLGDVVVRTACVQMDATLRSQLDVHFDLPLGPCACLEVWDSGRPLDDEARRRIFDPLLAARADAPGLELADLLGMARTHNGGVHIPRQASIGTQVRLYLPADVEGAERMPADVSRRPAAPWHGEGTVLVVDDETSLRKLLRLALERAGLQVVEAADGEAALEEYARHSPRLAAVLLDAAMPGLSGAETCARLRALGADLPIVLCSGYGESQALSRLRGARVDAFLHKPFRIDRLLATLRHVFEARRAREAAPP